MLSSNKYYVKVVFEDGTGETVKALDGKSSKTVKKIKGGSTSQQKKYAAALNQYDDTNKGSEKGDEQNYNKLVSAKQIGGEDLQTNNCLIWRISNSKVRTDGLKISAKSSKYVNWKAKVYIYKKSGSGASAIWTNVLSGKQVKELMPKFKYGCNEQSCFSNVVKFKCIHSSRTSGYRTC